MLTLALVVAGFGIATAVYLERPHLMRRAEAPAVAVVVPAVPHDPRAASAAVPEAAETLPPVPGALPGLEPEAGPPAATPAPPAAAAPEAPPAQQAMLEPEPASPAGATIAPPGPMAAVSGPQYWVEYGVFGSAASALRLQQELHQHGLAAIVVATHGRNGRKLSRVRSAPLADLAALRRDVSEARRALRLSALLHRGDPAAGPAALYRVQFGAFLDRARALRLSQLLARGGIDVVVSSVRGKSGKALYLVKSSPLSDHAQAQAIGERGRHLAQSGFLVERSLGGHAPARAPPHVADSR